MNFVNIKKVRMNRTRNAITIRVLYHITSAKISKCRHFYCQRCDIVLLVLKRMLYVHCVCVCVAFQMCDCSGVQHCNIQTDREC